MSTSISTTVHCELVADDAPIALAELCRVCGIDAALVAQLVEHGLLEPVDPLAPAREFVVASVTRVRTAVRLMHDLELNAAGAALAVDLLDEIARLRAALAAGGIDTPG